MSKFRRVLTVKQEYLDDFFSKYSLSDEEEREIDAFVQNITPSTNPDSLFKALKRLHEVLGNAAERVQIEGENPALRESLAFLDRKLKTAMDALQKYIQSR